MSNTQAKKILVIGAGRMGGAIVNGWLKDNMDPANIYIVDRSQDILDKFVSAYGVNAVDDISKVDTSVRFDFVMFALKPNLAKAVLPAAAPYIHDDSVLVSIAAGVTNATLATALPGNHGTVRVMPNTPALINKGVMVGCANDKVTPQQKADSEALFSNVGTFYWVEDEEQMHAVTGVSGSGPAYVFHFGECFVEAGVRAGLPAELAKQLAVGTLIGAAHMIESEQRELSALREEVTSPNGTTFAALNVFMQDGRLANVMAEAVAAAVARSQEMAAE